MSEDSPKRRDERAAEVIRGMIADKPLVIDETERLRVQLSGCLVAAEGGTSKRQVAEKDSYGWSPAYQAVLDLRREYDHHIEEHREIFKALLEVFGYDVHKLYSAEQVAADIRDFGADRDRQKKTVSLYQEKFSDLHEALGSPRNTEPADGPLAYLIRATRELRAKAYPESKTSVGMQEQHGDADGL